MEGMRCSLGFQQDSEESRFRKRKVSIMIRIVSSAVKTSLFAGAALVLAGAVNVYSDSCKVTEAKTEDKGAACETAVQEAKPSADGASVKGESCKAKCDKAKAACTKADGEKVKAGCPKDKAVCAKADGEKVKADCPAEKKCCGTCKPKSEVKAQETCPVMGGKINKTDYVDHDGKRIYVCCKGCIAPIEKDPAKYIKALEDQGVTVETVKAVEN